MTGAADMARRILCAIDTRDIEEAVLLADLLKGEIGGVKLGKEFFTAHGPQGVRRVAERGVEIFLDLKYHDIPNTVAGAVRAATELGVFMLTVHASGGAAMLRAAADASAEAGPRRPRVLGVTVLTSMDDADLAAVGQNGPVAAQVERLARLAHANGADGVICSPHEVARLRAALGPGFLLVVPGVRPAAAGIGDQKRVMTPGQAIAAGADDLVIGRPITAADDPVAAARAIAADMAGAGGGGLSGSGHPTR
jgi:orotidine-5'-phosphate decarboxylase